jgi:Ca2+-binding EF-hand superfamily protein
VWASPRWSYRLCSCSRTSECRKTAGVAAVHRGLDIDHDGTVSLDEAKKAAEVTFDKLDRDHDGTLTARELRGRLSAREFAAADTDNDGTTVHRSCLAY